MHICFISSEYPLWQSGGVGSFLQTFGRGLVSKGHKVTIIGVGSVENEELLNDEGVAIFRLPKSGMTFGKFVANTKRINAKIAEVHRENPIDIVESAELGLAFTEKIKGIKYVIRLHGGHHFFAESENRKVHWWQGFKERISFKNADGFIAVSAYVKSHTAKYLSYHNKPVEIINYPIDIVKFSPKPEIKVDKNNLTFAGTVCEKKGIRQLIMA
ncbi:MAG: glycosyltransferase family 4 protein, partial [Bacteroidota bacterium]